MITPALKVLVLAKRRHHNGSSLLRSDIIRQNSDAFVHPYHENNLRTRVLAPDSSRIQKRQFAINPAAVRLERPVSLLHARGMAATRTRPASLPSIGR